MNAAKIAERIRAIHSRTLQYGAVTATECTADGRGEWRKMNCKDTKGCGMVQQRYHPGKYVDRLRKTEEP
jgi:hypothetical protein